MEQGKRGLWALHSATLLLGGTTLFSKLISLSALDITIIRCVIASMVLCLLLKITKQPLRLNKLSDYGWAVLLAALVGAHWVTFFLGMQLSTIAIGLIAFYTYPVMTVFLEPLFNREKIQSHDIISALIVLIGISLLVPELSLENDVTLGIISGISSAFLFTLRNILYKRKLSHYSGPHTMFYQTLLTACMLSPFLSVDLADINNDSWTLLVVLGVCFTAMPHTLLVTALRYLKAKTVGLISCLQPLYGSLLAIPFLGEIPNAATITGGVLVVSAALFETWNAGKK
ncbi:MULTISPECIES: DMT family transporter [unclassified Moritella]|uniref:DMT family transporter n=1 Tax=unclassified Moritella TaxID=2637987 RepID=UPI001BAB2305|nr:MULTISPECIES: DMT family transporter [unclassified Moritella]QUM86729.1 EamA family transporter [Moritella sp. 28]QUM90956.1 EamA family transporter [Moritella sp. 36]